MNLAVSRVRAAVRQMLKADDEPARFNTVRKYVYGSFLNHYFLLSASDQCLVVLSFSFSRMRLPCRDCTKRNV